MAPLIRRLSLSILIVSWFLSPTSGHAAAACSTNTASLNGWYGMLVSGSAVGTNSQKYLVGALLFDGKGNITANDVYDQTNVDNTATGTYSVNADCTLAITLNLTNPATGVTAAAQSYTVGVRQSTNEAVGIETDASAVATIDLQAQYASASTGPSYTSIGSLNGTFAASCLGADGGATTSDLNLQTFLNGNVTGTDPYNNGGNSGSGVIATNFTATYTVNTDGTFVGVASVFNTPYTLYGVVSNSGNKVEYFYAPGAAGNNLGTGIESCVGAAVGASSTTPTFTLTPATNPWTLQQNAGAAQNITVTPVNGFSCPNPVALAVSGAPAGLSTGFIGNTLILYPALSTQIGTYPLTLTGSCGSTTVTTQLSLVIAAGANFTLTPASTSVSLAPGASATDAIGVSPSNGFKSAVSFSVSGFPSGASGSISPTSSASGATLSITTSSTVAPGTYPIVITAAAPASGNSAAFSNSVTVNLVVTAPKTPGFTLAAAANPLTLQQNAGGTDNISVTPVNGFSGSVSLAVSGAPAGVSTGFLGNLLIVFPASSTVVGTYPLTITGTSGSTTATTTLSLVITAGATFSLSPAATSITVPHGSSGTDAITVKPANGFNSAVSFAVSNLPTGVTAGFSPSSSGSSSTLTLAAASTAKPGTYTITVTGTAPGSSNSNPFSVTTTITLVIS